MTESSFSFESTKEERNPLGWILLALLFAISIFGSTSQYLSGEKPKAEKYTAEWTQFEQVVSTQAMSKSLLKLTSTAEPAQKGTTKPNTETNLLDSLDPMISRISQVRQKDPEAAKLFAAMRTEQGKPLMAEDLVLLEKGSAQDQAFREIYLATTLTPENEKKLSAKMTGDSFMMRIARVHAAEKAGDKTVRAKEIKASKALVMGAITVAACALLVASLAVWFFYFQARASGKIVLQGLPLGEITPGMADQLALRAGLLFAFFAIGGMAVSTVASRLSAPERVSTLVLGALMIIASLTLATIPIAGRRIPWKLFGLSTENLGRHILWGVCAWVANIPLVAAAAVLGMTLANGLPTPTHPVSEQLMKHQDPKTVLVLLFFGAVAAPIWEEIMFRGMLFPALSQRLKSLPNAAIMSSFLFAMIHPQGLPLWFALATIAGMNCALMNHTRSLVPSIVLHSLHNFVLLILTVVLGLAG
ncbi:MAG: CPBP family intramembrane glutamic endopeptidase [Fimbriimonas sp.]